MIQMMVNLNFYFSFFFETVLNFTIIFIFLGVGLIVDFIYYVFFYFEFYVGTSHARSTTILSFNKNGKEHPPLGERNVTIHRVTSFLIFAKATH